MAGYLFGNIPVVRNNFSLVTIGIVIVSLLPMMIELIRHKRSGAGQRVDSPIQRR
jgi:membrane-associated protein